MRAPAAFCTGASMYLSTCPISVLRAAHTPVVIFLFAVARRLRPRAFGAGIDHGATIVLFATLVAGLFWYLTEAHMGEMRALRAAALASSTAAAEEFCPLKGDPPDFLRGRSISELSDFRPGDPARASHAPRTRPERNRKPMPSKLDQLEIHDHDRRRHRRHRGDQGVPSHGLHDQPVADPQGGGACRSTSIWSMRRSSGAAAIAASSQITDRLAINFGAEPTKIVPARVSTEVDADLSLRRAGDDRKGAASDRRLRGARRRANASSSNWRRPGRHRGGAVLRRRKASTAT